jgi:hypothetical protein
MMHADNPEAHDPNRIDRRRFLQIGGLAGAQAFAHFPGVGDFPDPAPPPPAAPAPTGHALVVGISTYKNKYKDQDLTLPHSVVTEAVQVVNWLTEKGGVEARNVILLTSPVVKAPKTGVVVREATRKQINDSVVEIAGRVGTAANHRLYVYYSGHGTRFDPVVYDLNKRPPADPSDGMIPCNFDPGDVEALKLSWVLDYFRNAGFPEQFFFFDACRTTEPGIAVVDGKPLPSRTARKNDPYQFILYASAPGQLAADTGPFTKRLMEALRKGLGTSKTFDGKIYWIRWLDLALYLIHYFSLHPCVLPGRNDKGGEDAMLPTYRQYPPDVGLDRDGYPVLATLTGGEVGTVKVRLQLDVSGSPVDPANLKFTIVPQDSSDSEWTIPPGPPPVWAPGGVIRLQPLRYIVQLEVVGAPQAYSSLLTLRVRNQNATYAKPLLMMDLMGVDDDEVTLVATLVPQHAASTAATANNTPPPAWFPQPQPVLIAAMADAFQEDKAIPMYWSGAATDWADPSALRGRQSCLVSSYDPLATLEVADVSGATMRDSDGCPLAGVGRLDIPSNVLKRGNYWVRHSSPGHETVLHMFAVHDRAPWNVMFLPRDASPVFVPGEIPGMATEIVTRDLLEQVPVTQMMTQTRTEHVTEMVPGVGPRTVPVQVQVNVPQVVMETRVRQVTEQVLVDRFVPFTAAHVTPAVPSKSVPSAEHAYPVAPSKSLPTASAPGPAAAPSLPVAAGSVAPRWERILIPVDEATDWLDPARNVGPGGTIPAGGSGFRVFLIPAASPAVPARPRPQGLELQFRRLDAASDIPLVQLDGDGVDVVALKADAGTYLLRAKGFGTEALFALTLIDGRLCDVVFQREPNGGVKVLQLAPKALAAPASPNVAQLQSMRRSLLLRLTSDLQRGPSSMSPEIASKIWRVTSKIMDDLTKPGDADPIALLLKARRLSIRGEIDALAGAAARLVRNYPRLTDGYVAKARAEELRQPPGPAKQSYRMALDHGLPVLQTFLEALWEGARRHEIAHPRLKLLETAVNRRIPGVLWTAWTPEAPTQPNRAAPAREARSS